MVLGHLICILMISADQLIKYLLISYPIKNVNLSIPKLLNFLPSWNTGSSFGMFSDVFCISKLILIINSIIISQIYRIALRSSSSKYRISYFTIIAGGISNCIDRVIYDAVYDFLEFCPGGKSLFIFNLSDLLIAIGVLSLIFKKSRNL